MRRFSFAGTAPLSPTPLWAVHLNLMLRNQVSELRLRKCVDEEIKNVPQNILMEPFVQYFNSGEPRTQIWNMLMEYWGVLVVVSNRQNNVACDHYIIISGFIR